ncbi:MAG TPA: Xaa-Pro peptidase family protein [Candidatus Saccharimonadales bacterium]|nr:Xaa-Pro peptidase family protein [Candidatus Saccharimonadales bacterium]
MNTRLIKVRELLQKEKLDAALISSVPNIIWLTNYDGFSKEEREAFLLITKNKQYLLTDARYTQEVKGIAKDFEVIEISQTNRLKNVIANLCKKENVKKLGVEEDNITVWEKKKLLQKIIVKHFSVSPLRQIKDKSEIEKIYKACNIGDKAFDYILSKIESGVSETDLKFELEQYIRTLGADISFSTIVAFGKNAAIPHHQTNDQRLKTNSWVLMDFGVKFENYCSDMTRTVFLGKANDEQKKMYQTVLTAQQKAIEKLSQKNLMASNVDKAARDYIISQGYPTIPHSLGHGIGIEVHELPHISPHVKTKLEQGMVFSVEPGIYLINKGGVRIEDLVVLEKSGPRLLTKAPKNLIEL